ncbi:MAG: UbiX family flavin prenyltransferase [Phycisphaerales bacterium]|nr:UbiX family flavin prenyltransferase [Phycisphaerales bacterium]MCB9835904.1 UbiX family flavin prenyltransferase [Phycisphaera sp.]
MRPGRGVPPRRSTQRRINSESRVPPRATLPSAVDTRPKRFVVGITGASGAAYALRTLELLLQSGAEVHLVVSEYGQRLLYEEAGIKKIEPEALLPELIEQDGSFAYKLTCHPNKDVGALIASGSYLHDGMVVVPCSSTSLGAIATGSGSNLLTRAAMVTLKERRRLIVCHRESPLSLVDIENMRTLTLAGAIICPTNPGFYLKPMTVGDIVDFTVGKILDLLGVEHSLATRWEG